MTKKIIAAIAGLCLVFVGILSLLVIKGQNAQDIHSGSHEMIEQIDKAIQIVDDGYKKQSVTQAIPITYADAEGNKIVFYQCHTEYFEAASAEVTGLNMDAIQSVMEVPEEHRDCMVNDCSAAWFENTDRAYLCWTISPEVSCIIEYDPNVVEESDIIKMAESVEPYIGTQK